MTKKSLIKFVAEQAVFASLRSLKTIGFSPASAPSAWHKSLEYMLTENGHKPLITDHNRLNHLYLDLLLDQGNKLANE